MDAQLLAQCAQTIIIARAGGVSSAGDPTYGSQVTAAARVEQSTKMVRRPDGSFIVSTHAVITPAEVGLNDRVWLPGADTADATQARLPLQVDELPDEFGAVDHYEVLL